MSANERKKTGASMRWPAENVTRHEEVVPRHMSDCQADFLKRAASSDPPVALPALYE